MKGSTAVSLEERLMLHGLFGDMGAKQPLSLPADNSKSFSNLLKEAEKSVSVAQGPHKG